MTHPRQSVALQEWHKKRVKLSISDECLRGEHFLLCPTLDCPCICHRMDEELE